MVAVREAAKEGSQNNKTIVCFPGFLETSSYFLDLYGALDCELVFVNNANYHSPFASANIESLDWPTNPYESGSIEYDGFHLALAVKNFASYEQVVLHGHSRGGAVVLDAGRQFPEITNDSARNITAVLEAAVLPQAKAAGGTPGPIRAALMAYLMPFMFSYLRGLPAAKIVRFPMMKPNNPHKTDVLQYLFKSAKQIKTLVANMLSLAEWQKNQTVDVFKNYQTINHLTI